MTIVIQFCVANTTPAIMTATSLRLPDEIKALATRVAEREGKTPHAYLLEVVSERVKADAARQDFEAVAEQRWQRYLRDGKTISIDEMRKYLLARAAGQNVKPPRGRKLGR
jgi:predicted DNA-binding protein